MIKVKVKNNEIIVTGHAGYDEYGKDIVCASASSIIITSVNACLRFDKGSISYKEEKDKLTIRINKEDKSTSLIIENMLAMLKELAQNYNKNIKIEEEERP